MTSSPAAAPSTRRSGLMNVARRGESELKRQGEDGGMWQNDQNNNSEKTKKGCGEITGELNKERVVYEKH